MQQGPRGAAADVPAATSHPRPQSCCPASRRTPTPSCRRRTWRLRCARRWSRRCERRDGLHSEHLTAGGGGAAAPCGGAAAAAASLLQQPASYPIYIMSCSFPSCWCFSLLRCPLLCVPRTPPLLAPALPLFPPLCLARLSLAATCICASASVPDDTHLCDHCQEGMAAWMAGGLPRETLFSVLRQSRSGRLQGALASCSAAVV